MSLFIDFVNKEAAIKKKTVKLWLENIIDNISKCTLATHVGKITNPAIKDINIWSKSSDLSNLGYIITNEDSITDITATSAHYSSTCKLLYTVLEDGENVLTHILNKCENLKLDFDKIGVDYKKAIINVAELIERSENNNLDYTSSYLKQVFFPLGDNEYHLLSVLPPSSNMFEIKRKIDKMSKISYLARDKKSQSYGETHSSVKNLTVIKYGGAQPQNISYINSKNSGMAYLLPALPPHIKKSYLTVPKKSFFAECLDYKFCRNSFIQLGKLWMINYNNQNIRSSIKNIIRHIIDRVLIISYEISNKLKVEEIDISKGYLPNEEKVWLKKSYDEILTDNDLLALSKSFSHWFRMQYLRINKKSNLQFSDNELAIIRNMMLEQLRKEVG